MKMRLRRRAAGPGGRGARPAVRRDAARPARTAGLFLLPLLAAACQSLQTAEEPPPASTFDGEAFAQASCGGCHAVGRSGTSPNPDAPPFASITNHEGVTAETLSPWLRGGHNFPLEMNFTLTESEADRIVAYMLTLRDPNYRRPNS